MAKEINIKQKIAELERLEDKLQRLARAFETRAFKSTTPESNELIEEWGSVKHLREKLFELDQGIDLNKRYLSDDISEDIKKTIRPRLERDIKKAENLLKSSPTRVINSASKVFDRLEAEFKNLPVKKPEIPPEEEPEKVIKKEPPVEKKPIQPKEVKKIITSTESTRKQNQIAKEIENSIDKFNRKIPVIQKDVLAGIEEELRSLDLDGGKIKATVKNLALIARIKNKLIKLIVTDEYKEEVKAFAESFNKVTELQNAYWKELETTFKPKALLREIRNITIEDTVNKLMESGINSNLVDPVSDILRTNITAGGSYRALTDQLKQALTDTNTPGLLNKYAKTTTVDSLNTYSAQYTQIVSSDLGFEWYKYSNTDIETTRPFCDAMTDRPYFHVSEIPQLLRAEGLTYVNKKGQRVSVPIYQKTGLPHGMKEGTNASNFLTNRGGWHCGHQCRPVSEGLVPKDVVARVKASPAYLRWKSSI